MLTVSGSNEATESTSLPADVNDDCCRLQYIEIVPLTRVTDGSRTTACNSEDLFAEVKQEVYDVCFIYHQI